MTDETKKLLEDLHNQLTLVLLESVQEGENLNVARQFLRDNGIDVSSNTSGGANIHKLASDLPFQGEDESIAQ